jgi:hypothetical protein
MKNNNGMGMSVWFYTKILCGNNNIAAEFSFYIEEFGAG